MIRIVGGPDNLRPDKWSSAVHDLNCNKHGLHKVTCS